MNTKASVPEVLSTDQVLGMSQDFEGVLDMSEDTGLVLSMFQDTGHVSRGPRHHGMCLFIGF